MRNQQAAVARAVPALLLVAGAAGLLAASPLPAQQEEAPATAPQEAFFERVDVNLITVDVVVTDKEGNPVTGLGRDDFEVREDGRPMAITNFYAVEGGARVAPAVPAEGPPGATAAPPSPPAAADEEPPLYLVVYVDNVHIRPVHRPRVFRDLRLFLNRHVKADDRVMLVSYERSLKVRHGFTGNPRQISDALFELEDLAGNTAQADEERRNLIERIEEARGPDQIRTWLRIYSQSVQNDLRSALRAVRELVESLAGLPGRKALVYVSDGLPMTPGEEFYVAAQASYPRESFLLDARGFDASSSFQELAALANSNRVSFYTLDAAGIRVSSAIDVERKSGGAVAGFYTTLDSATVSNLHSSLKFLADATGGAAIVNTNNFGPGLDRLAGDFESYYSLGYPASHFGDGRYHEVAVEVTRRGLDVRHREGYRDKPLRTRMTDATLSTLKWGLTGNNELGVRLDFRPSAPGEEKGEAVVPMVVEIPLAGVSLLRRGEVYEGRVKLYVAVADPSRVAPPQEVPVLIQIPAAEIERARQRSYKYTIPLRIRTGGQRVAVGVWDELGAVDSFLSTNVEVSGVSRSPGTRP